LLGFGKPVEIQEQKVCVNNQNVEAGRLCEREIGQSYTLSINSGDADASE